MTVSSLYAATITATAGSAPLSRRTGRVRRRASAPAASGYPTCVHAIAPSDPQKTAFGRNTVRVYAAPDDAPATISPRGNRAGLADASPRRGRGSGRRRAPLPGGAPGPAPSRRRLRLLFLGASLADGTGLHRRARSRCRPVTPSRSQRSTRPGSPDRPASCCSASSRSPSRLPPRGAHFVSICVTRSAHCCRRAHGAVRVRDQVHADPGHGDAVLRPSPRSPSPRTRSRAGGSVAWLVAGVAVTGVACAIRTAGVALGLARHSPFPPPARASSPSSWRGSRRSRSWRSRRTTSTFSSAAGATSRSALALARAVLAPPLVGGGGCQRPDLVLAELGLRADHRRDGGCAPRGGRLGALVATPHARPGRVRGGDDGDHPAVPDRAPALLPAGRSLPRRLLRARREAAAAAGGGLRSSFAALGLAGLGHSTFLSYTGDRFPERYAGGNPRTAPPGEAPVPATRTGWKSASTVGLASLPDPPSFP